MEWETVTFDCYGTLVDWETGIAGAFREAAAASGVDLAAGEVLEAYHRVEPQVQTLSYRPYKEVLEETAVRVAEQLGWQLRRAQAGFLAESLPGWPVFRDTRQGLERLGLRFDLAILSNIDDDLLNATIERIGVEFAWTVTAEQTRSYKPALRHFQEAVRRVGGRKERLLHAAQSQFHDIRPACELGLAAAWVNRQAEALDGDLQPRRVLANLNELADWLGV
jgi:2-haloalkanoic acid dehalogenase type II